MGLNFPVANFKELWSKKEAHSRGALAIEGLMKTGWIIISKQSISPIACTLLFIFFLQTLGDRKVGKGFKNR